MTRIFLAAAPIAAIALAVVGANAAPLLIYNPSPSVPAGFYLRTDEALARGALVTVRARDVAPAYAKLRRFDGPRDRFIKRIAGAPGDVVCAKGDAIYLNRQAIAHRLVRDRAGRALPRWSGCARLSADQYFLLGDTGDSFDGRYWGPVSRMTVDGVWRRLL